MINPVNIDISGSQTCSFYRDREAHLYNDPFSIILLFGPPAFQEPFQPVALLKRPLLCTPPDPSTRDLRGDIRRGQERANRNQVWERVGVEWNEEEWEGN